MNFIDTGEEKIDKVAVVGGSGGKFIKNAKNMDVDLLITGDVTYHTALDALDLGVSVLDIGHHSEAVMKEHVSGLLNVEFGQEMVSASEINTNPFAVL